MNQPTVQPFPVLVQKFVMQRLQEQRHVSPRTVMAYRDSFRLLLAFASSPQAYHSCSRRQTNECRRSCSLGLAWSPRARHCKAARRTLNAYSTLRVEAGRS